MRDGTKAFGCFAKTGPQYLQSEEARRAGVDAMRSSASVLS
jgi:hypothetical protein